MAEKIKVVKKVETPKSSEEKSGFDFMELLSDPALVHLLEGGKELFKKEKPDPNVCEINIKAPTEVVLKLFRVDEK